MDAKMAQRFGANVSLDVKESRDRQLFLVRSTAASVPLAALMAAQGARVVLRGANWLLAEMGFQEALSLKRTPGVASIAGVAIDPARFELFRKATGIASAESP